MTIEALRADKKNLELDSEFIDDLMQQMMQQSGKNKFNKSYASSYLEISYPTVNSIFVERKVITRVLFDLSRKVNKPIDEMLSDSYGLNTDVSYSHLIVSRENPSRQFYKILNRLVSEKWKDIGKSPNVGMGMWLVEKYGISKMTYSLWRSSKQKVPSIPLLIELAKLLNVTVEDLLGSKRL